MTTKDWDDTLKSIMDLATVPDSPAHMGSITQAIHALEVIDEAILTTGNESPTPDVRRDRFNRVVLQWRSAENCLVFCSGNTENKKGSATLWLGGGVGGWPDPTDADLSRLASLAFPKPTNIEGPTE